MNRNYFLVIAFIAIGCLFLIFFSLWREIESPGTKEPAILPPLAPYHSYISGVGIVEASSDNVFIGASLNRVVDEVFVSVGDRVKKGDVLFRLEDRDLRAELQVQQDGYEIALAKWQRLKSMPRSEDLAATVAALNSSQAELELTKNQYEMVLGLADLRAISQEDKNRRHFNYQQAQAKWQQAQADYHKIKAGTWKPDLDISQLEARQAQANVRRVQAEIQRTVIQSPIDGTVLQVKVHEGEFSSLDALKMPMMILGNTDEMFLRVSINQLDIPYFHKNASAVAFSQGDSHIEFPLEFVRVEPFLVVKENLTNELTEKVDTRVLQIIYRIKKNDHRVFVGQQMDVFIETENQS